MQSQFLNVLKTIGNLAAAQLSGPWAFIAKFVLSIVVKVLDYYGVKHELKKQSEQKLADFEKAMSSTSLSEVEKDEARRNFLK